MAQGIEKGMAQGIEKGMAQGIQQGRENGIREGIVATARKMLSLGLGWDVIEQATGLTQVDLA